MKRIYILLIAVFSLGMGGCNYVDVDPVGKVIPDEVSEYRALLTTAYRYLSPIPPLSDGTFR